MMRTIRWRSKAVMGALLAACFVVTITLMAVLSGESNKPAIAKTNKLDSSFKARKDAHDAFADFDDNMMGPAAKAMQSFDRRSIQQVNGGRRDKLSGLNADNLWGDKPAPSNNAVNQQVGDVYVDGGQVRPQEGGGRGGGNRNSLHNQLGNRPQQPPGNAVAVAADPQPSNAYPMMKNSKFIAGNRIVHFDLKGAAPTPAYLKQMFSLIKQLGGTGVLLEWEDMFPYEGPLKAAVHHKAYSKAQIREILSAATDLKLDIIPLVQTFGHLEWFLKLQQFAKYRQVDRYPQVICLGDEAAVGIVKDMLSQVISIHKEFPMPYLHMGADEAFQVGMCKPDQDLMEKELQGSRERLMLRHIARIAAHIRTETNNQTKVLMWHDMLNNVDSAMLNQYSFGSLVEPVVWMYAENLDDQIFPDMWSRFAETFPYMWAASAFKGADGPHRFYSNVPHYLKNHVSWLDHMTAAYKHFREFRGIILTGWQRFDHFAILCETWPVGVPSMAVNLQVLYQGIYDRDVLSRASKVLNCSQTLDIDYVGGVAARCAFPGYGVYENVQRLQMAIMNIEQNIDSDYQVKGWLSRYNIEHNISQAWYLDQINDKVMMALHELQALQTNLRREMPLVFQSPDDTTDEFIYTNLEPQLNKLLGLQEGIRKLTAQKTFPVRPFDIRIGPAASGKGADGNANAQRNVRPPGGL